MSISCMILGESGTGKTTSLRNLDPADVLLIQTVKKPLPFRAGKWKPATKENPSGAIFVCDKAHQIIEAMQRTAKPIIIIDDFQYLMANEFMRRSDERGYDKFTEIARHAWEVLMSANRLEDHKRVYILAHTQTDDTGRVKAKTIGKMLDEKITIEGLLTIVLRTAVVNGNYLFNTQNSGQDTTKSPLGLFDAEQIDNDLAAVDAAICEYFGLSADMKEAA